MSDDANTENTGNDESREDAVTEYERTIAEEMQLLADKRNEIAKRLQDKTLEDPLTMQIAKDTILDLVPDAAITIRYLITHAESENIRMSLSKYVFDLAMKSKDKIDENDDLDNLIKSLTKPVNDDNSTSK